MGHLMPIVNCATVLKEAGHEVHIVTNGNDEARKTSKIFADHYGIIMNHTNDKLNFENEIKKKGSGYIYEQFSKKWYSHVLDQIDQIEPDIIVSDYYASCAAHIAYDLKIPLVVNVSGSFNMVKKSCNFEVPQMNKAKFCCGLVYFQPEYAKHDSIFNVSYRREIIYDDIWMVNSFFGVDKPICLPPNLKFVGSIGKPANQLEDQLREMDPELFNFLEQAHNNNEFIVYVSLGSLIEWQKWSIDSVFEGLMAAECKVVWQIPDKYLAHFSDE